MVSPNRGIKSHATHFFVQKQAQLSLFSCYSTVFTLRCDFRCFKTVAASIKPVSHS